MKSISLSTLALLLSAVPVFADSQSNFPVKGGDHPQVTIIEFSDFQCPFCSKAESTLNQALAAYKDQLQLVHRNMPLPMHAQAEGAAVAGVCAQAQGKFWELHDLLFQNQSQLGHDLYLQLALKAGLNISDFRDCLDSPEAKEAVQVDRADAETLQIQAVPSFLLVSKNRSVKVTGSLPFAEFKKKIDDLIANP